MLKYSDMDAIKQENLKSIKLSCNALKFIACVAMFIDHTGYGIIHNYLKVHSMDLTPQAYTNLQNVFEVCKGIGRIAFPIFCFFLVEGFMRTHNIKKYALRLFIFAIVSELPFDFGLFGFGRELLNHDHQNVIMSFFIALIMLVLIRYLENNVLGLSAAVKYLAIICAVIGFADIAYLLKTDYSWKCMMLVAILYMFRSTSAFRLVAGAAAISWEKFAPISFALLYFYDPDQKPRHKYAFYVFYPLHLILIGALAQIII